MLDKKYKFISSREKKLGGDIDASLGTLPGTPCAKYPGKKQLPGCNYCGPGTILDIRLAERNQPKPGESPVNAIDQTCHVYDVAYKSPDLQQRHIADVKLILTLKSVKNKNLPGSLANWLVRSAMKGKLVLGAW